MKALRDVLLYSMGMLTDADGDTITDKLPFALTSCAGVAGYSNGGNITLCTLGSYGPELQGLCWLATWESPIGDQYVKCELGGGSGGPAAAMLNPYYIPGTAGITEAPTPGMESVLSYDPAVTGGIEDPRTGAYHEIQGLFYLDENENSAYDAGEFRFSGSAGPGSDNGSVPLPRVYFSDELTTVITDNLKSVLGGAALPGWLAGRDLVEQFWKIRDGSLWIDDVHKHFPDMPVIVSGTSRDHMQAQPDHPHLVSFQKGLGEADHFFWRVNPDAAYIAALSGGAQADYPEYKAFEALEYSEGFSETLPPPGSSVGAASVCELADRVMYDEWSADLDEVIVE
jgi:hypothetical protein